MAVGHATHDHHRVVQVRCSYLLTFEHVLLVGRYNHGLVQVDFTSICSRVAINSCIVVTRATVLTLVSAKIDIECFPEVNLHCTILLIDNI